MKKNKMFLNPKQPLSTCTDSGCTDCSVRKDLSCHFNSKQLVRFLALFLPPMLIGGYGIVSYNPVWIVVWILLLISYFGFVEIRVLCSHCPHYAEPNLKSLKCWANYGSPKLWKYRPGPMTMKEKIIFKAGGLIVFIFPIPFLIIEYKILGYIFLGIYCILIITAFFLLRRYYCSYCINFACPFNNVDNEIREKFFTKNQVIKDAWRR